MMPMRKLKTQKYLLNTYLLLGGIAMTTVMVILFNISTKDISWYARENFFLNNEQLAYKISERLGRECQKLYSQENILTPIKTFHKQGRSLIEGKTQKKIGLRKLNLLSLPQKNYCLLATYQSKKIWIIQSEKNRNFYLAFPFEEDSFFSSIFKYTDDKIHQIYLLSRNGNIIYSNQSLEHQTKFVQKKQIKTFISRPFNHLQQRFKKQGKIIFYHKIYGFNLIFFSSIGEFFIYKIYYYFNLKLLIYFIILFLIFMLLIQIPIKKIKKSNLTLMKHVYDLLQKHYILKKFPYIITTEHQYLHKALLQIALNLEQQQKNLERYLTDQNKQLEINRDLEIARYIQNHLVIKSSLPKEANISISTYYHAAERVSGDWFGYFYDKREKEFIAAIVDVSGHGFSSGILTAVIATLFLQFSKIKHRSLVDFINQLNEIFLTLAGNQKHATAQILRIKNKNLSIVNAGHVFPFFGRLEGSQYKVKTIRTSGEPVGLGESSNYQEHHQLLQVNDLLLLYTDGLVDKLLENTPPPLTKKQLKKIIMKHDYKRPIKNLIQIISGIYSKNIQGQTIDDVCLVGIMQD